MLFIAIVMIAFPHLQFSIYSKLDFSLEDGSCSPTNVEGIKWEVINIIGIPL